MLMKSQLSRLVLSSFALLAGLPALNALPSPLDRRGNAVQTTCKVSGNVIGPNGARLMTVTVTDLSDNEVASGSTTFPLSWEGGMSYPGNPVGSSKMKHQMLYSVQPPPLEGSIMHLPPGQQQWMGGWFTFQYAAWGPTQDPVSGGYSSTIKTDVSMEFPCWLYS